MPGRPSHEFDAGRNARSRPSRKRARASRALGIMVVGFLLVASGLLAPAGAGARSEAPAAPGIHGLQNLSPTIATPGRRGGLADSALRKVVRDLRLGASTNADVEVRGERVDVEIGHASSTRIMRSLVRSLGGRMLGHAGTSLVEALVPYERLADLQRAPGVRFVRSPLSAGVPDGTPAGAQVGAAGPTQTVTGSEVTKTNASSWIAAGFRGAGVKVGIVDFFASGYWNPAQSAGELPAPAGTFCRSSGAACNIWTSGSGHGQGVAEIIHEMAPDAELYLATVSTTSDLQAAINYFGTKGVKIVSRSLTAQYDGAGDGTGPIAEVIDNAVSQGITWFNSAGNSGGTASNPGSYWRGAWTDADGDRWMEFAPGDETMGFDCAYVNGLRWSDWGVNPSDYDLYVIRSNSSVKASSLNDQVAGAEPIETVNLSCTSGELTWFAIWKTADGSGTAGDVLEIMTNGARTEYWQNPFSATGPASDTASAGGLSIGAVDPAAGTAIAPYSSRGPTNDNRIKPDMSGASCVASYTYSPGCFNGTSASTPVVAGAAALVVGAALVTTPAELKTYMKAAVVDRGAAGSDNVFGTGELRLPNPPATAPRPTITKIAPVKGPVGKTVTITGTKFTGATKVTFGGIAATFTVTSATKITTKVPVGGKTGKIKVTTPGGTATSAQKFTVT